MLRPSSIKLARNMFENENEANMTLHLADEFVDDIRKKPLRRSRAKNTEEEKRKLIDEEADKLIWHTHDDYDEDITHFATCLRAVCINELIIEG